MAAAPTVEVVGLKALARDLAKASDPRAGEVLGYMKRAGVQAANPVADATRSSLPHDTGSLSGDVRVSANRTGATIRMGRKSIPYAGWVEFGGTRHRPHTTSRPFIADGRYLFPAARQLQSEVASLYSDAIGDAFAHLSWTNPGDQPHD